MSTQNRASPTAEGLAASARATSGKGPPPVHLWNPPFCGNIDMRIARDGRWYHEGGEIRRPTMVRLFSSILRKDGEAYFLVTPAEKVGITVEDAPFVVTDFEVSGTGTTQDLTFQTQVGDKVTAGPDHRLWLETRDDAPAPYLHVRHGLNALLDRKSFYRLVELGEVRDGWFGLWSGGVFFPLQDASDF